MSEKPETAWDGKYIKVIKEGRWEYVCRTRGISAVVILAVEQGKVILVEQHRVPIGRKCLELPAGLVGDEDNDEDICTAAIRELEEETGYRAEHMTDLGRFHSSPGMTSEGFNLVRGEGLTKVGDGGGVEAEDIAVHLVPFADIPAFIEARRREGVAIDVRLLLLLGGLFLEPLGLGGH